MIPAHHGGLMLDDDADIRGQILLQSFPERAHRHAIPPQAARSSRCCLRQIPPAAGREMASRRERGRLETFPECSRKRPELVSPFCPLIGAERNAARHLGIPVRSCAIVGFLPLRLERPNKPAEDAHCLHVVHDKRSPSRESGGFRVSTDSRPGYRAGDFFDLRPYPALASRVFRTS